ncbi:hypothetical protein VPG91_26145 [Nitrospirillum amazonense]|uniref:hypothetical protein n=1 Tax=Nitrospirillum amazonense TaxID=28077 RepID=UPI002DD44941|nr:hypothetical protein [Nitrospirillum amazonense]MEC4594506.1 hypothetical protein [Nitrospirillum amazonense]
MALNTAAPSTMANDDTPPPPSPSPRTAPARGHYVWAVIAVLVAPLLAKLHLILGFRLADPRLLHSGLGVDVVMPRGLATLDPNVAITSQALGHRAALDLLAGHIPWWNPYEGVGGPMAGEMQSAALFPLNLLLALPDGQLYMHLSLQLVAGLFTVLLMRRLGTSALAAGVAGLLFEFNGTFAWLANAVVNPIPFLPMVVLGVEEVRHRVVAGLRGGWAWIVAGLALSLYAGFPEVAYLDGLLVGAWTLARLPLHTKAVLTAYAARVGLGVVGGLALAAPILIAFLGYLPYAFVGGHEGNGFRDAHVDAQHFVNLTIPYLFGRLADLPGGEGGWFWGSVGGYMPIGLTALAIAGCFGRPLRGLRWTLAAWTVAALAAIYGLPVIGRLITSIPAVGNAAFFRYLPPSAEFSVAILAGLACQDMIQSGAQAMGRRPAPALLAGVLLASATAAAGLLIAAHYYVEMPRPSHWFRNALCVAALTVLLLFLLSVARLPGRRRAVAAGAVVAVEAVLMFVVPTTSNPPKGILIEDGVRFLQAHLGLQRFFSMGPVAPNYGAYYGIAGINHDDLPLPRSWVDYVAVHLDANVHHIAFDGKQRNSGDGPSVEENLRANLAEYEKVGVRYVVTAAAGNPFRWTPREFRVDRPGGLPIPLSDGGTAVIGWNRPDLPQPIEGVGVLIGTYGGKSDGVLRASICADDMCADQVLDLTQATDNQFLPIKLDHPLPPPKNRLTVTLRKTGAYPVALWSFPSSSDSRMTLAVDGYTGPPHEVKINIDLAADGRGPSRVYDDRAMTIFELPDPAPYFSAEGCQLQAEARDRLVADCAAASILKRQELFLPGWTADVVGMPRQEVRPDGPIFQRISLPAGRSEVRFNYSPPYMQVGYALFLLGIGVLLWSLHPAGRPSFPLETGGSGPR